MKVAPLTSDTMTTLAIAARGANCSLEEYAEERVTEIARAYAAIASSKKAKLAHAPAAAPEPAAVAAPIPSEGLFDGFPA